MITKNSASNSPVFKQCLDSIYRNVPVNRLFVVDAFSKDDTVNVLSSYPRVQVYQMDGNRAVGRQFAIDLVKTPEFAFIDDDVILCEKWYEKARIYMKSDVGLVWGFTKALNPHARNRMKIMCYLQRKTEYDLNLRNFVNRGGLHDALIRKKAIENILIPKDLHVYEDWFLKNHVESQGFKTVCPENVFCHHFLNPNYDLALMREISRLEKKYGIQSTEKIIRNSIMSLPKSFAIFLTSGDLKASKDQMKMYIYGLLGHLGK